MQTIIISALVSQGYERREDLEELIFDTLAIKSQTYSYHIKRLGQVQYFVFFDEGVKSLRADVMLPPDDEDSLIHEFAKIRSKWLKEQ
jgi:hypothetical protein